MTFHFNLKNLVYKQILISNPNKLNNNFKNTLLRYLLGPESRIEYCGNEDINNTKYDHKKIFKKMFKTQLLKIKCLSVPDGRVLVLNVNHSFLSSGIGR